jgi:pimeloyl-ACP methyl ester carboxylesterase
MHDFHGCRDTWAFASNFVDARRFTWTSTDVRGNGEPRHIAGAYTPAETAADILALADNLGWERFRIVGHSMSGMLAQRVEVDGGPRVKSAVLDAPVAASGHSFTPKGFAIIEGTITSNALLDQAFDALTGARLCPEWREFKIRQTRSTRLVAAQKACLEHPTVQDFLDGIRGHTTPMLTIIGDYGMEPCTGKTARETFAVWYPNAEIAVCGNAGHYPQQEAPVYVATIMKASLARQVDQH